MSVFFRLEFIYFQPIILGIFSVICVNITPIILDFCRLSLLWLCRILYYINHSVLLGLRPLRNLVLAHVKNYDNFHHYRHFIEWHISKNSSWKQSYVYIRNRIIHGRLEIWNLTSRVQIKIDISVVRYRFEHSKINSISPRAHVLFYIVTVVLYSYCRSSSPPS